MSEIFTKIGGFVASGDPLVYADSATMTGDGTVASPFGVNKMDMFVQAPLFTGTSGEGANTSAYIGVEPSALSNETVLWEGTASAMPISLSESPNNFELLRVDWCPYTEAANWLAPKDSVTTKVFDNKLHLAGIGMSTNLAYQMIENVIFSFNGTTMSEDALGSVTLNNRAANENIRGYRIYKIVGVNRKPEA